MEKSVMVRFIRERIKQLTKLQSSVNLPADSHLDECAEDIIMFLFGMPQLPENQTVQQYMEEWNIPTRIKKLESSDYDKTTHDKNMLQMVGQLSMKLNKMESSLREFEKQRVDPIKESVDSIHSHYGKRFIGVDADISNLAKEFDKQYGLLVKRIEKVEYETNEQHGVEFPLISRMEEINKNFENHKNTANENFTSVGNIISSFSKRLTDLQMSMSCVDSIGHGLIKLEKQDFGKKIDEQLSAINVRFSNFDGVIKSIFQRLESVEKLSHAELYLRQGYAGKECSHEFVEDVSIDEGHVARYTITNCKKCGLMPIKL